MLKKIKDLSVITPIIISLLTLVGFFGCIILAPNIEVVINAIAALNIACAVFLTAIATAIGVKDGLISLMSK